MARVFITGSTDGLGFAAAASLVQGGHAVVLHARNEQRADDARRRLPKAEAVLVGDLASRVQTLALAERAEQFGGFDAVIHNAAVGPAEPRRIATPEGHSHLLAINVLAPYILTARMAGVRRLIYMSSGLNSYAEPNLDDVDWVSRRWNGTQAYSESKLFDTALAAAITRRWPEVLSNSVAPGWVATKMGGADAPDDLSLGHVTQAWLAVDDDPRAMVSGRHFYHQHERAANPAATDPDFQDALMRQLEALTGVQLPTN